MYQTSNNYKNKIYEDSTRHLLKIFINDVEIDPKYILDFNATCTLFENNEFCLGAVCARTVHIKLYKAEIPDKINKVKIITGIETEEIPFGVFTVDSKKEVDDYTIELDLIDDMVKFEPNYDGSNLTYPTTMLTVLNDICVKFGVELRFYFFFKQGSNNSSIR